ncbi:NUDIX domain-containing protein [Vibrio sp. 404]|uniref:NUDIX domain-containing protein n=1 Tax=Vibrio marinisediminis TaxID=2758441 RepID=A0A7W2FRH5_9VIBR|nr:NUDIX domain-containing protein [Vibrio marinisediminis]MBA5762944.1 NUDIX domain-containing protein [Vibrio marinisediminis]
MKNIAQYLGIHSLIVSALLIFAFNANAQPKGAVCIIKSDSQLVMVDEILTGKWSLPAGTINPNEQPQLAAQREAWEETGLVVTVGDELGRSDSAIYYDCVSDSDLIAFGQQDKVGGHILPIWFAPHYGLEVSQARLIDPFYLSAEDYRYPLQWEFVQALYQQATDQPTSYVESLVDAAPRFNQPELQWIAKAQSFLLHLPSTFVEIINLALLTGLVFTSHWWLLLLPICYAQFGRDFTLKLMFTLMVGALIVQVGKLGFQLPRPYVYQPSLNMADQIGFGLPSLAVALWTISFSMLINQLGLRGWNKVSALGATILMWLVAALFYSGSAFLVDSFAGLLLGWLCAWHMSRLDIKIGKPAKEIFNQKGVWLMLMCVSAVLLVVWQTPMLLQMALVALSVLLVIILVKLPRGFDLKFAAAMSVVLGLTLLVIGEVHTLVDSSNLHSLVVEVMQLPLLFMVFTAGLLWHQNRLEKKKT